MKRLREQLDTIDPLKKALFEEARNRLDRMAIPRGSLGRLEEFAQRIVAITGRLNPEIKQKKSFQLKFLLS